MSDRPTPEVDEFVADHDFQPTVSECLNFAVSLERQRDAYAYTLRVILQSAGQHVSDAIRHTHPELAGNETNPSTP